MSFLSENITAQILYREWFNEKIFGSRSIITNRYYSQKLEKIFNNNSDLYDFEIFLLGTTGKKWLKSEQGKLYQKWQNG